MRCLVFGCLVFAKELTYLPKASTAEQQFDVGWQESTGPIVSFSHVKKTAGDMQASKWSVGGGESCGACHLTVCQLVRRNRDPY